MDGLLIDSEPLWEEAGKETLAQFGVSLTDEQYHFSTGLRTREWVDWWFTWFNIDKNTPWLPSLSSYRKPSIRLRNVAYLCLV